MTTIIIMLNTIYKNKIKPNTLNKYILSSFMIILIMMNHKIDQPLTNNHAKELLAS